MSTLLSIVSKLCVKTTIIDDSGNRINQGSGVIIKVLNKYYVITAYHCIYGEKDEYLGISLNDICVECQSTYDSSLNRISIKSIINFCKDKDWMILNIEEPQIDIDYSLIHFGNKFIEEPVQFIGFQNKNTYSHRPFKANIISIGDNAFRINLNEDTFQQQGEDGALIAKGLSGSGVFITRTDRIYLIGILNSVIGEFALNDDINCTQISFLENNLSLECRNMQKIATSGIWEDATEKECTEADISRWVELNDKYFNNFLRKNSVLHNPEKAQRITREKIIKYIETEFKLDQIRKQSSLITKLEETSVLFEADVKDDYTKNCTSSNDASSLLRELKRDFKEHISGLINDASNKTTLELANHKITEWLMNCSFDFTE